MTEAGRPDRGLDGLNLLSAAIGTAYGAFIPVYLTAHAWTQTRIGLALTVATVTSIACQVPAGMWVDAAGPARRRLAFGAVIVIGITPLLLLALPRTVPVMVALAAQAAAGTLLSPTIAALSLARVGHDALGERLGRNARYGSIGAGLGAAVMGISATWIAQQAVFIIAFSLMPLALLAVRRIGPDADEAVSAARADEVQTWTAPLVLLREGRVLMFGLCLALFQVASIAVLQLAAVDVTARTGARSGLVIAAFVILPQAIVALVSPRLGAWAGAHRRRAVLLAGFATTPLRAAAFALIQNPYALVGVQVLEGTGGAVFGVMLPLVADDLTRGTRRYTMCIGVLGLASTLGTALSTAIAGFVDDRFGRLAAYLVLAAAGAIATLLVAVGMPETRPETT